MRTYKGFTEDLKATYGNGIFQYEPGKTYREEKSKTRSTGFHAAEYLPDCMMWYGLNDKSRFFLCESGGSIDEEDGCSMVGGRKNVGFPAHFFLSQPGLEQAAGRGAI